LALEKNNLVQESLTEQANRVEQETRMVLPGIQALFGFQLIAAFNERFIELSHRQQMFHWCALAFTAVATMLTMAPAAFHRQAEPTVISKRFVHYANCWLTLSLIPLMLGICIDFYLIGVLISKSQLLSAIASLILLSGYSVFWFLFPLMNRVRPRQ
jgi:hypothetical protein